MSQSRIKFFVFFTGLLFLVWYMPVLGGGPPFLSELRVGERLTYDVKMGMVSAGTQVVCILEKIHMGDAEVYHIISYTKTNPFFSIFYKMDNRIESFIDSRNLSLRKMIREINEGNFHMKEIVYLDLESGKGYIQRNNSSRTIDVPPFVLTLVSLPYYLRSIALEVNQEIPLNIITDRGIEVYTAVVDSREEVKTEIGKFLAFKIVEKQEKIKLWIGAEDRIPLKIQIGTNFGDVVGILKKVE